jgi:glycosyltransferase involved in cell wall biosynthesis
MKTVAAIPTLNAIEWVAPLVEHILLNDEVDEVWVYDNGCTDQTADWVRNRRLMDKRLFLIDARGMGLYQMWNDMVNKANELDDQVNLAFLNSDIRLPPKAIFNMSRLMREGDYQLATVDPTISGLYSQHFIEWNVQMHTFYKNIVKPYAEMRPPGKPVGWAVVIAAEFWKDQPYAVHPSYQWWYGDDDLFKRAYARGAKICIVRGIGSDHLGASSDAHNPRKQEMIDSDTKIFNKMWLGIG